MRKPDVYLQDILESISLAGMRDIIIHEYFGVTLDMIWVVVTEDLHDLKARVEEIIESNQ